ncbi:hypothetical protein [Brevifollis gellanilyticus]|uniref:Uncharacterized protein n=1 Tax=Brevifollis gellanilyticus TaxID=748831 RepID=A0A512M3A3_9BACT|nr:hypothetical protein [Brevifollis gellanilyticus]GEP41168.1 hypothetical protein BGE01nite_04590 [Brevifollis gellanilyticus]
MPPKNPFGVLVCLFLGLCLQSMGQPAVTVRIATVQEEDWRRESSQGPAETLRDRLKAQTVIELHGGTAQESKLLLRSGKEQPVVQHWDYADDSNKVIARKTDLEWIGTQVMVQPGAFASDGTEELLDIEITHDIAAPDSRAYQYATAAKGAERDKHTVTLPRLHRLHWKGELPPDQTERAIASFPLEDSPGTRLVVFFHCDKGPKAPLHELTQTIYRVPELEMVELLLANPANDAAIIEHLEKARTAGRASIVSEVSTLAGRRLTGSLQAGTEHHLPSEMNPEYDLLYQLPASFEPVLEGTKLDFHADPNLNLMEDHADKKDPLDPFSTGPVRARVPAIISWHSHIHTPGPLAVSWPTSWLHVSDRNYKPTGKAITGFMDWYDRFGQMVMTDLSLPDNTPRVVAMLPPADQVWGAACEGRWLDVIVARRQDQAEATPAKAAADISSSRLLIGISLDSRDALALLEKRGGQDDSALLRQLIQRVKARTAQVRLSTSHGYAIEGHQHEVRSTREHVYPTEMPSIPSAWNEMEIGTMVQSDGDQFALEQDLAPPGRMEWKLALDVPEAIMWEPSRRFIRSEPAVPSKSGTYLCSAAAVPVILAAPGMPAGETLLIFSHQGSGARPAQDPSLVHQEIEALIFEVPESDADVWQALKPAEFAALTARELNGGRAKLSGHMFQRQRPGAEGRIRLVEEQMTATEFDPPEKETPGRMRPTALETLPVGTSMEAHQILEGFGEGTLIVDLQHSIAKPVEPTLPDTLKIAATGHEDYPGAKHLFSEWKMELPKFQPNEIRCLGVRKLPGNDKFVHIAYIRLREAK